ncbi:putative F-box protein [Panicum miliaceum]|uniref:F-box protein n=1 Tax=Panicum miliaceum TaxID=4540 RepID=A0A3L6S984_PANMI|nr:putative F-box protein [Panicum miliaceum]
MGWSTLPGDLVRLVAGHLHDPLDFLHLRAVCRSWRSAAASSPPPPFLPWLLARPAGPAHPTASLFLLFPRLRRRPFPSNPVIQGYLVPASSDGDSPAPVVPYNGRKLFFHFDFMAGGEPTTKPVDRDGWTEVPVPDLVAENMYHDGKLFVCDDHGQVTVFDAATVAVVGAVPPPPPPVEPPRRDAVKCTALLRCRVSGHELLCVIRCFAKDGHGEVLEYCGAGLEVYRLEMETEKEDQSPQPQWVRMRSIGDRMLFIGLSQGFSFSAADLSGFKGDCICFFKLERDKRSCIYRFSMEDGRTEELPSPWMHACTWFVPSLS